jgi:hypothetical protein
MVKKWNDAQGVTSKANIPANAIKEIQEIVKNENYLKQLETFETRTRADSEKEAGVAGVIESNLKGKNNISFTYGGEKIILTPREIAEIKLAETQYKIPGVPFGKTAPLINRSKLSAKQLKFVDALYGTKGTLTTDANGNPIPFTGKNSKGPQFSPENVKIMTKLVTPHFEAAKIIKEAYDKAENIYKQKLGESANAFVPKIKAVANPKGEVPPIILQKLNQLVIAQNEKGIKTDDKWDFETASSYFTDKLAKDTRVIIKQDGDNYTIQLRNLQDPDNTQSFKVNSQQVRAYLGNEYVNDNSQVSARFAIGKGKSDINRTNVATDALMQKRFGDFPGIKKLQVTANLEEDTPGLFIPTIYLKQKDGKYIRFEIAGDDKLSRVGFEQGKDNLNALNDEVLLKVLKQSYPSYDFSKIDY